MGVLLGGFNESLVLYSFILDDFSVRSVFVLFIDSFCFFFKKVRMELDIDLNNSELWGFLISDFFFLEYFFSVNIFIVECSVLVCEGCVGEVNVMSYLILFDFEILELRNVNFILLVILVFCWVFFIMFFLE